MKKLFTSLLALAFTALCSLAHADAYWLWQQQRNATDTGYTTRLLPTPVGPAMVAFDPSVQMPLYYVLGTSFAITSGVIDVAPGGGQVNTDWLASSGAAQLLNKPTTVAGFGITDAVTNSALSSTLSTTLANYATNSALTSALAAKFNTPTGTTSQYVRGDGTLATLPTTPARSFSSVTPTLNSCFQLSATRDARVSFGVDVTVSVTLGGTPKGSVYLRYYTDSGCTTAQQTVISGSSGLPSTLSVVVGLQNLGTISLAGTIPAGTWARVETVSDSGTPTFATRQGQVILE